MIAQSSSSSEYQRWLQDERDRLQHQFDVISSGACRTGFNAGSGWVDTTEDAMADLAARIAALDRLLGDEPPNY